MPNGRTGRTARSSSQSRRKIVEPLPKEVEKQLGEELDALKNIEKQLVRRRTDADGVPARFEDLQVAGVDESGPEAEPAFLADDESKSPKLPEPPSDNNAWAMMAVDGEKIVEATVAVRDSCGRTRAMNASDVSGLMAQKSDTAPQHIKELSALKFGKNTQILAIESCAWRIICSFLDTNSPKNVQNAGQAHIILIGLLHAEVVTGFMEERGYSFVGELAFSQSGIIPVSKTTWEVGGDDIIFTSHGDMFFDHESDPDKNVVVELTNDGDRKIQGVFFFSKDTDLSKKLSIDLATYAKEHNCLRGQKLRDVNVISGTFGEVKYGEEHTWENFYYPEEIRDMFELEVFGFLSRVDEYAAKGISKRGVLLHGPPGCVCEGTKITVRKKKEGAHKVITVQLRVECC